MVKRGALSKLEKYYLEGNASLPIEDLAKELDRSEGIIGKFLGTIESPTVEPAPVEPVETEPKMLKAMGRHTRNGQKVATVMTPGASKLADDTRPQRVMNKKLQQAIHKPMDKK